MDRHAAATLAPGARTFELAHGPDHVHAIQQSHARCRALGLTEDAVPELNPLTAYGTRVMREPHQRLLEQYAPPSIVVTEDHDVLHVSGRAGRYLRVCVRWSRDERDRILPHGQVVHVLAQPLEEADHGDAPAVAV